MDATLNPETYEVIFKKNIQDYQRLEVPDLGDLRQVRKCDRVEHVFWNRKPYPVPLVNVE